MLLTILLGIISSTVAEIVTALNKKLAGTLLKGDGAFIVAFALALIAAVVKEITAPGFQFSQLGNWQQLSATFGEVFTVSQLYFLFVVKKLNLDVGSTPTPNPVVPVIEDVSAGAVTPIIPE